MNLEQQQKDIVMTDEGCQQLLDELGGDNHLWIDSKVGIQVMNYIKRKNHPGATKGNNGVLNFKPFISPIDQKEVTGLQSLKEHNKRHGVEQVGHDYEKVIKTEREKRNDC